jgi:hypothetical protein
MVIGNQSGRIYERDQAIGVDPNHSGEFQLRFRPSMLEPVAIGMLELLQEPPFTLCGTRQHRGRASLQDLIFECRAFGIVLLEPFVRGDRIGKHLEMIGVANMVFGIYVNPDGRHRPAC